MKPIEHELYLIYECPHCGSHHYLAFEEARQIGKVYCNCKQLLTLEKILGVDVKIKYAGDFIEIKPHKEPKEQKGTIYQKSSRNNPHLFQQLVSTLVRLGYKSSDAKHCVGKFLDNNPQEELFETMVEKLLKNLH